MKKKKILVTGSEGLIGSSIIKNLSHKKFIVIRSDKKINTNHQVQKPSFIKFLDKKKPDIVIHCAAHPGGLSMKDPMSNINVNLVGTFKIIKWCIINNKKIVFLSSSAVYGEKKNIKIKESSNLNPMTIYGINKLASEKYILELSKYNKFQWLIIRLFATYGPGHKPNLFQGIVNIILTQLKQGKGVIIKGSLKRTRDLIYVEDVGKLISKLIELNINNKIINMGTSKSTEIRKIIEICSKYFPKNNKKLILENKTQGDPMHAVADISELKKIFKKLKFTKLELGIKKTFKNFKIK